MIGSAATVLLTTIGATMLAVTTATTLAIAGATTVVSARVLSIGRRPIGLGTAANSRRF